MKISSFLTMAVFVAGMATTCFTMTSCAKEDNAADEDDEMKEEIEFDFPEAPSQAASSNSYIVEAKVLGYGDESKMKDRVNWHIANGWKLIDQNLNQGAKGKYVYLIVRMGSLLDKEQGDYITDFYLSNKNYKQQPSLIFGNRTYFPVGKEGDEDFDGNLNSKTKKGDKIYLYYTKENIVDFLAVTDVTFDDKPTGNGVVGKEGQTTGDRENVTFRGYNLNEKAGGQQIYMHLNTGLRTRWKLDAVATDNSKCLLNGFDGPTKDITAVAIPTTYNGVKVTGCGNFTQMKDLKVLYFYDLTNLNYFPSLSGSTNLESFCQLDEKGKVVAENKVPNYITKIGDYVFQNTAIESIDLPTVTEVGENAFRGCNSLKQVVFGQPAKVGSGAFCFIKSEKCEVSYPGSAATWDKTALYYSPNVVVAGINDKHFSAYWGWCGGESENEHNGLSWKLDVTSQETVNGASVNVADLNLFCAIDSYRENQPDSQRITKFAWEAYSKDMKLENLYLKDVVSVGVYEFRGTPVRHVHLYPGLKEIGYQAFANLNTESITYHGTQEQWDAVKKDGGWNLNTDSVSLEVTIQP